MFSLNSLNSVTEIFIMTVKGLEKLECNKCWNELLRLRKIRDLFLQYTYSKQC